MQPVVFWRSLPRLRRWLSQVGQRYVRSSTGQSAVLSRGLVAARQRSKMPNVSQLGTRGLPTKLRVLLAVVIGAAAIASVWALTNPLEPQIGGWAGLAFWVAVTLIAVAAPVRVPGGTLISPAIAPLLAAAVLGGPFAAAVVGLVGVTEWREVRGDLAR